jgi:hypothetical protein
VSAARVHPAAAALYNATTNHTLRHTRMKAQGEIPRRGRSRAGGDPAQGLRARLCRGTSKETTHANFESGAAQALSKDGRGLNRREKGSVKRRAKRRVKRRVKRREREEAKG